MSQHGKPFNPNEGVSVTRHDPRWVSWTHYVYKDIILKTDGCALMNLGRAGHGGLLRTSSGRWLRGYFGYLGVSNNMHAELMGILQGLHLAWDMRVRSVLCVCNSLVVVNLINGPPRQV
ncbi:hypothetical protein L6164_002569 [Bauhinia variegata]|uniref:Uncharacterized protein n=1 Tax=Bauhinia variegata TaxID=167791 RepID=A0ACB9PY34_BAUVA|nr:hypothetical protein L6164_002569 [Bauhinia variegata]